MNTPSGTVHRAFPVTGPIHLDVKVGHRLGHRPCARRSDRGRRHRDPAAAAVRVRSGRTHPDRHARIHAGRARGQARRRVRPDRRRDEPGSCGCRRASVPSGTATKIVSYGADIVVEGRTGNTDIAAGSSRTELDYVDGDLRLRYGSGPARVARVAGTAEIKSGSGTVRLGDLGHRLVMACGSGNLEVDVAHGPVSLRAGSGQADIGIAEGDVDLVTGSGGLTVGLRLVKWRGSTSPPAAASCSPTCRSRTARPRPAGRSRFARAPAAATCGITRAAELTARTGAAERGSQIAALADHDVVQLEPLRRAAQLGGERPGDRIRARRQARRTRPAPAARPPDGRTSGRPGRPAPRRAGTAARSSHAPARPPAYRSRCGTGSRTVARFAPDTR